MKIQGLDATTGETIERQMTSEEMAEMATLPQYNIPQMSWPKQEETPTP